MTPLTRAGVRASVAGALALAAVAIVASHYATPLAPAVLAAPDRTPAPESPRPAAVPRAGVHRLVGHTVTTFDKPFAGATVTLEDGRTTRSGATGAFAFDDVAEGEHRVRAERGMAYGESGRLVLADASVTVRVAIGPALAVHVRDRQGRPIAGAVVDEEYDLVTDAAGTARFRAIGTESTQFGIRAAGYATQRVEVRVGDEPHSTVDATVVLDPAVAIGGVVLDPAGEPVAGAVVDASSPEFARLGGRATTDAAGRWRIDTVGAGEVELAASTDTLMAAGTSSVRVGTRPRLDLVLRVEPGATVGGVVVDAAGQPLAGVHVDVSPSASGGSDTDAQGRFAVAGVPPALGKVDIDAATDTLGTPTQTVRVVRRGHAEVRLVLVPSTIAGIVITSDGKPVANAIVTAGGPLPDAALQHDAVMDGDGRFHFAGLPPGDYHVWVHRDSDAMPTPYTDGGTVHTGRHDLAVVAPDVGSIRGRVVLAGAPVDFFGATVTDSTGAHLRSRYAPDGRFELDDVETGTVSVEIVGPHVDRRVVANVVVRAGQVAELGDVGVTGGWVLRGRVVGVTGAPVARAVVVVQRGAELASGDSLAAEAEGARTAITDASGHFAVRGLPGDLAGFSIQAREAAVGLAPPSALSAADLAGEVALVLVPTGAVSGIVVDDPTGPISHEIRAMSVVDGQAYTATSDHGRFAIPELLPGDYAAVLDNAVTTPVLFRVEAGETTAVELGR